MLYTFCGYATPSKTAYNSTSRNKMKHFIYNPIIESNTKIKRHEKLNLLGKWKEINVNDIQTDICILR